MYDIKKLSLVELENLAKKYGKSDIVKNIVFELTERLRKIWNHERFDSLSSIIKKYEIEFIDLIRITKLICGVD